MTEVENGSHTELKELKAVVERCLTQLVAVMRAKLVEQLEERGGVLELTRAQGDEQPGRDRNTFLVSN